MSEQPKRMSLSRAHHTYRFWTPEEIEAVEKLAYQPVRPLECLEAAFPGRKGVTIRQKINSTRRRLERKK